MYSNLILTIYNETGGNSLKKYANDFPKRKTSYRLPGFDYSQPGGYFITICTCDMHNLFGVVNEDKIVLNHFGKIVETEWYRTAELRANVEIYDDEFIIMPNHIHGILWILDVGATGSVARSHSGSIRSNSLGAIVGQFKSQVSRRINMIRGTPGQSIWQRNFYDRIIRDLKELNHIRNYIEFNPYKTD